MSINITSIRDLIIPNNTCNEQSFIELDVSMMSGLERISIGENSLQSVSNMRVYNTPSLKSLSVGRNSFSSSSRRLIDESGNNQFYVKNCNSLININYHLHVSFNRL